MSAYGCELILNGTFKRFANDLIPREKSAYLTLNIHRKSGKFGLHYSHPAIEVRKFPRLIFYDILLYGSVSQGLGTTKFTNLIGRNGYWTRSIISHLDRHLDRSCLEVKKSQTKMQNHRLFSSNNIYFCKCQKADERKKVKRMKKLWKN